MIIFAKWSRFQMAKTEAKTHDGMARGPDRRLGL